MASLGLTATGFSWTKLDSAAAAVVSDVLSALAGPSVLRSDATDLLALPALALAWQAFRRARRRPAAATTARGIRAAVLIPVALLGTLATSKATVLPPPVIAVGDDGRVWYGEAGLRYVSADGGRTFSQERVVGEPTVRTQDCHGGSCYRVVSGELRVESSVDGGQTWTTSWEATPGQRRDLIAAEAEGVNATLDGWESSSLVVIPAPGTTAGHGVLLANGRAGLWMRDGQGRWSRIMLLREADGVFRPAPARTGLSQGVLPGGGAYFAVTAILLVLLLGGLGVVALRAQAPWRISRWPALFAVASVPAIAGNLAVLRLGDGVFAAVVVTIAGFAAACLGLAVWLVILYRPGIPAGYLVAMLGVAGVSTVWMEYLRQSSSASLFPAPMWVTAISMGAFAVCALLGLGAHRMPRPQAG